jgi:RNA polymerase sigma-70 factor (ECF subfamily)
MKDFDSYYRTHQKEILKFARSLGGTLQDAEDLAQEGFYRACRGFHAYRGDKPFKNWMCAILVRLSMDRARTARRRPQTVSFDHPLPGENVCFDAPSESTPESIIESAFICPEITGSLSELKDPLRDAANLVLVEGLGYEDAGEILGCPSGTVRSRIHRARKRLRTAIQI